MSKGIPAERIRSYGVAFDGKNVLIGGSLGGLLVLNLPEVGELRKDQYEKKIYTFIGQRRDKL